MFSEAADSLGLDRIWHLQESIQIKFVLLCDLVASSSTTLLLDWVRRLQLLYGGVNRKAASVPVGCQLTCVLSVWLQKGAS